MKRCGGNGKGRQGGVEAGMEKAEYQDIALNTRLFKW